jgi:large conductance mechanosensitive channel
MSVIKEFAAFIKKGNVVDLAVAVVIGGAFGKIVSAVVADLVMPLVNALVPQGDWRKWEVSPLHFRVGDFIGTVVDFLIVAFVIFLIMVKLVGAAARKASIAAAPAATKTCAECLETVPAAARRCRACTSVLTALALMLVAGHAFAQSEPKFTFAKPEEVKAGAPPPPAVEWKSQAKGGLLLTAGNSQTTNATLGFTASRKQGSNKLSLDGGIAYGRSNVLQPVIGDPVNAPTTVTDVQRTSVVTTNNWLVRGRYDRFFTTNNAGYAAGSAAADTVAGKTFIGGGQIGYSRQVVKTDRNLLVAELGYDFSYERYVQPVGKTLDPVSIHSARVFAGETFKLSPEAGATASVEAFFNLNREDKALNVNPPHDPGVAAFHDTRLIGKVGLTATVWKALSAALGFTVRYDQNPAPLPMPAGAPMGAMYAATFQPFAESVDVISELTLIYTFL